MTTEEYIQLKAFARIDGAWLALVWTASFALYIGGMTNPLLMMAGMLVAVCSPFFVAARLRRFRDRVREGYLSFRRAYAYSALTFFYGALLFAVAQFVYFQFIDQGYIANRVAEVMGDPQMRQVIKAYGMGQAMDETIQALRDTRPIDYALSYFTTNVIIGILLSLPVAGVMKKTEVPGNKTF